MANLAETRWVHFLPDDLTIAAIPGEPLLTVAERAGIVIPTGCLQGACRACEVEIEGQGATCACISAVPPGATHLTIHLYADPTW
jgi:ferredoxin